MYKLALSPAHEAFLAATFAANRARYAGWRMEIEPDDPLAVIPPKILRLNRAALLPRRISTRATRPTRQSWR